MDRWRGLFLRWRWELWCSLLNLWVVSHLCPLLFENWPCKKTTLLLPGCRLQARNMRLLERPDLGACRVLVADSSSNRVAGDVEVPTGGAAVYHMPRFSEVCSQQM